MAKQKNILIKWLRDAHAMEASAESILSKQVSRMKDYPRAHQRFADHLEETRRHQDRLEGCIEQLGGDTSMVQEMVGKFSGSMQAFTASGSDDEVVKAMITGYQFESLEVATYRSLIVAAEVYSQPEVARVWKEILAEEEDMASWVKENISEITRSYLSKQGVGISPPPRPSKSDRSAPPPL